MNKAVFLDRDGIINNLVPDGRGGIRSPRTVEEFSIVDGVATFLKDLQSMGYMTIVVTNQPDLARGKLSRQNYDAMEALVFSLPVDFVYLCPHDDYQCTCRKPSPNMLFAAAKKYNLDLSQCFMFGDSWRDMIAGKAAGCKTMLLCRNYNFSTRNFAGGMVVNLKQALAYIKGGPGCFL